jgi:hypothetical protein
MTEGLQTEARDGEDGREEERDLDFTSQGPKRRRIVFIRFLL